MPETDSGVTAGTGITGTGITVDSDSTVDSDVTADTAHFKAFATRGDDDLPAPWQMRAGGSKIGILAGALLLAVILAIILGVLLVN